MVRYLSEQDVQKLLTMDIALQAMEEAHKSLAEGKAVDVPRARIHLPGGTQHVLQAAAPELGYIGFKYYYSRPAASVVYYDREPPRRYREVRRYEERGYQDDGYHRESRHGRRATYYDRDADYRR